LIFILCPAAVIVNTLSESTGRTKLTPAEDINQNPYKKQPAGLYLGCFYHYPN